MVGDEGERRRVGEEDGVERRRVRDGQYGVLDVSLQESALHL